MKIIPTEEQEHFALMDWLTYRPSIKSHFIHIPNGGSRHILEAKKLKRMGVKKGVSDFFLAQPAHPYAGLWIELKRKNKKIMPSKEQQEWIDLMNAAGYKAVICYGAQEAIDQINAYLTCK